MPTIDTATIPSDYRHRREWIKFQLRVRGSSLSQLARELGVTRHTTILALARPYPRIERAIAKRIGLRPEQVWPERYDEHGKPNRKKGRPIKSITKVNTAAGRRNVHARRAA